MSEKTCIFDGCNSFAIVRNLCTTHYQKDLQLKNGTCVVDDCDQNIAYKGLMMCRRHGERLKKWGDPLGPKLSCFDCGLLLPLGTDVRTKYCKDCSRIRSNRATVEAAKSKRKTLNQMRKCSDCGISISHRHYTNKRCELCTARISAKNRRDSNLKKFNIDQEIFDQLLRDQNNRCAICQKDHETHIRETGRRFGVDHDHNCCDGNYSCGKCVRGLLCIGCNTGLGGFGDNTFALLSAACYLVQHRTGIAGVEEIDLVHWMLNEVAA